MLLHSKQQLVRQNAVGGIAVEKQNKVILILDLSAAFDTIEHTILLTDSVTATALHAKHSVDHFIFSTSYSENLNRTLILRWTSSWSWCATGFCLRFHHLHISLLKDIIASHNLDCITYSDDTQLYIIVKPSERDHSLRQIENGIKDIRALNKNKLKLNDGKTEVLHVSSRHWARHRLPGIKIREDEIQPSTKVRHLGVIIQ